jgi:flagellar biosynthesis chaperone FliJ
MTADLRRFRYPLEPLLRQREWQLESLRARLGRVLGKIESAARKLDDARERYRRGLEHAARELAERLDPTTHPRLICWLARLRETIASSEQALADLRAERATVAAACLAHQLKVELLARHRADCVAEFQREEERRLASDADREWLSRERSEAFQ